MTREQANYFLNKQLEKFVGLAQNSKSVDEEIRYTDAVQKLYLTLNAGDAFEKVDSNSIRN